MADRMARARAKLDDREQCYLIDGPVSSLKLFVRRLDSETPFVSGRRALMYVHGATFPSALSIAYRFNGRSWRDALCDAGFDVWALDFQGFGGSERYPEMEAPSEGSPPLCLAADAVKQLEVAVRFILAEQHLQSMSLVTHSWGSMPAGLLAAAHPTLIDRILMFAPLTYRQGPRYEPLPNGSAWKIITIENQWDRFVEDLPAGEPPVLNREQFVAWGDTYLDSDPDARDRSPPGVKTPNGPFVEILRAWHGQLAWEPEKIEAPVAIVRGAWDGVVTEADAHWLFDRLSRARERRSVTVARGTHLMHIEEMRSALWRESIAFLVTDDHITSAKGNTTDNQAGAQCMKNHQEATDLPGYNPGSPEVAKSPITMDELKKLKASTFFGDEDIVYLRLSYDVLKDQSEELVKMWRGIIALHEHLAHYSWDINTGKPDKEYGEKVGKRFAQWVLDTARAEYNEDWLNYQYEIGLRHHRAKKNKTDHANSAPHIAGRDLIAFSAAIVAPMRPYLEKGGHSPDVVNRMYDAWWKSMILQVTLWSQPYMNEGDF